jgi:hypothetical protein
MCACPEDRPKIYLALRTDVAREDTIRLSGNLDPDVCLPAMQGPRRPYAATPQLRCQGAPQGCCRFGRHS